MKALLALVLVLFSGSALSEVPSVFSNPTAGFTVTKPVGWHYVTAEQNLNNLKATQLSDKEFQAAMVKYSTTPMVAMTKYKEPYDDVDNGVFQGKHKAARPIQGERLEGNHRRYSSPIPKTL